MRRIWLGGVALTATLTLATSALSAPIFIDDFQDGQADGWGAAGTGDVRLTTFQDNVSLRLTGSATATTSVSTAGYGQVTIAASLAALSLGRNDACIAEVSTDRGATWREIISVRAGADDGVTLHRSELAPAGADDNPRLLLRFRAAGGAGTMCWGDAVTVTGQPLAAAAGTAARTDLTFDSLMTGSGFAAPVDLSAFAPPPGAEAPPGRLEGRLTLDVSEVVLNLSVLKDETADTAAARAARATLPAFDFAFVQEGSALIPLQRGPVAATHSEWAWVLEPGRVWREEGDHGWLRAAVPFALAERNANCLHNGVLTFLLQPDGAVSRVALEVASATCAYLKFDAWGMVPARFAPGAVAGSEAAATAWRQEFAARLPVRPVADLVRLYPGVDPGRLDLMTPADGDPASAWGLVVDGGHYAGPCRTRHGDYPFCEVLALPSYSTAKSIVGGVGLMRLEALYPGTAGTLIRDHVPACARGDAWTGVTLGHAADMATGIYGSTTFEADENAPSIQAFFEAGDHAAKVAYACGEHRRRTGPGRTFVYHTTDTYLLGVAMADIFEARTGGDLYADLVAPLWRSLSLSPTILETRRTADAVRQPFTGWGLTYHSDDIVRIAGWLDDGALVDGRPALDTAMLEAALQRNPVPAGLPGGGPDYRYKTGFWARNLAAPLGCDRPVWTPFMSGYGGISVVLLPGDMTFYYFGDSGIFDWSPAAVEAAKIKGLCR